MITSSSLKVNPIHVSDTDLATKGLFAIIPAFNREYVIGSVILQTKQHVEKVIVVDDGSSDRTSEVAKLAGAEVIRLDYTTGKSYALLFGLQYAYKEHCQVAVTIDANGQHNPMDIERVAGQVLSGKADLVIGSRYLNKHAPLLPYENYDQMRLESGTIVTDSTSSFLAFSRKALASLNFPSDSKKIIRDLVFYLDKHGFKISEVSITLQKLQTGISSWDFPIKVLAAMPAHNEEKFIARTILLAQQHVDCVLVVDDGSTDSTGEIAKKLGAMVVHHEKNSGYGAALRTIFEKAKKQDIDALVIIDADGQHDPNDIPFLLERLGKGDVDVVIGSRFIQGRQQEIPLYRIFGMKVLDQATKIAGVENITDSQSGFRAYGKKAIASIQITKEGMAAGSEILIQVAENGLKIAEIPIIARYDIEETSSQNPVKHGFLVLYNIIGLISYRRPLRAFGIPGFILEIIGFVFGSWAVIHYYTTTEFPFVLAMVSALCMIVGVLLMITALILNYLVISMNTKKSNIKSFQE